MGALVVTETKSRAARNDYRADLPIPPPRRRRVERELEDARKAEGSGALAFLEASYNKNMTRAF